MVETSDFPPPSNGDFPKQDLGSRVQTMLLPNCFVHFCKPSASGKRPLVASKAFFAEADGVTAIEYGLIAALISVVIIGAVTTVGTQTLAIYARWSAAVTAAIAGAL